MKFNIIELVYDILEPCNVDIIEGWYDKDLNKTHITVHEYLTQDDDFYDDENLTVEHNIQVDVWGKYSKEVNDLRDFCKDSLKKADFIFNQGENLYETDTKIYHRAMRFTYIEELKGDE
ncbi:hypothetical protein M4I33_13090 [Clostridium sp. LY3-2]|uniref:hypothetical protein n=1 Tax=Clostridium sp. LY3-2 TaxID=2942482 RepID=UPI0021534794|nr:hypothetical protein [Clostridium sp. LY3-2]MCR6515805.1 hypothetical protein [Clostridium sp. LY3-2]